MDTEASNVIAFPSFSAPEVVARRRRWHRLDGWAVCSDPDDSNKEADRFDMKALPFTSIDHLAYIGLTMIVGRADDMDAAWIRLMREDFVTRKPKVAK